MKPKITPNNVKAFITGYTKMFYDDIVGLPLYVQEQIAYRASKCPDCLEDGKCKECGCAVPGKWYVNKSCNGGERFPDLMSEPKWKEFKDKQMQDGETI